MRWGALSTSWVKANFGSSDYGYEEPEPAFSRMQLGNLDVKIADQIAFELLFCLLVAFDLRQPRNIVALKASMQWRTRQMGNGRLERLEAIIKRQRCMPAKRDNDGFLFQREHCRVRLFRTRR